MKRLPLALLILAGCEGPPKLGEKTAGPTPSASAAPPVVSITKLDDPTKPVVPPPAPSADPHADPAGGFPLTDVQLDKLMNPSGATEYAGATGTIEGIVRVKGDPPVVRTFQALPKGCEKSVPIHAPSYRAGPKGELADVLVAVLQNNGYVRASRADKHVIIKNCSIQPRSIDLSLGQRLLVGNADDMPYSPQTVQITKILRLALKDQSPIPLLFVKTGAYGLTWLTGALPGSNVPEATVYVIPSALHQVTAVDGRFRIVGVPVGKAYVTASYQGMPEVRKEVDVKAGAEAKVELEMIYTAPPAPVPAPSASGPKAPVIK